MKHSQPPPQPKNIQYILLKGESDDDSSLIARANEARLRQAGMYLEKQKEMNKLFAPYKEVRKESTPRYGTGISPAESYRISAEARIRRIQKAKKANEGKPMGSTFNFGENPEVVPSGINWDRLSDIEAVAHLVEMDTNAVYAMPRGTFEVLLHDTPLGWANLLFRKSRSTSNWSVKIETASGTFSETNKTPEDMYQYLRKEWLSAQKEKNN